MIGITNIKLFRYRFCAIKHPINRLQKVWEERVSNPFITIWLLDTIFNLWLN